MGTRIVFRADGNEQIGAGHVMRCLALACAGKELGCECLFVMAGDSFKNVVESFGVEYVILESNYTRLNDELPKISHVLVEWHPDVTIVDSYFVNNEYFKALSNYSKIVYIDDYLQNAFVVDGIINYNALGNLDNYIKLYNRNDVKLPFFLLGPEYAPLRKEFQDINVIYDSKVVHNVLFSAGGADPERIALKFVKELVKMEESVCSYTFHIVLGSFEPDKKEIKSITSMKNWIVIHENVSKMSELMLRSQIAISAAGSTLYELCACGVPTITYVLEDNQMLGAKSLTDEGIMIYAGDYRIKENFFEDLIVSVLDLANSFERRSHLSRKAKEKIDGNGAQRLIKKIVHAK